MSEYCDVAECEDPKNPGFPRVAFRFGKCSTHVKQIQRTGRTTAIAEKLNPEERAIEAGTRMLEAEAEDDEGYKRARRAFLVAARALGDHQRVEAIRRAMRMAAARGRHIGRPPKVTTERVVDAVRQLGRVSLAAELLEVDRQTIYRHLHAAGVVTKGGFRGVEPPLAPPGANGARAL